MRRAVDVRPLQALAGRIDEAAMTAMNARAELDGLAFAEVARQFLAGPLAAGAGASAAAGSSDSSPAMLRPGLRGFMDRLWAPDLWRLTLQHLGLVFGSLALAAAAGVPLGVWAWRRPAWAVWVLGAVGVLQTIPSLALLAFLIALMGAIGFAPALVALFLYALLPIVRNTHAGLGAVPQGLSLAARALGMTHRQVLWSVQLPLARPLVWAGIKTAAIINVGTATMAAFIGAGGLGERIVSGLAVNDTATLLAGALPAAVLALLVQFGFDAAERRWSRPRSN
jgi:osmoprotectant transport system permease protein